MKITKGDWKIKVGKLYAYSIETGTKTVAYIPANDEAEASAALIAEAGTVHNETGYTPRELAEQKAELVEALKKYGDHLGCCYQTLRMGECNCGYLTTIKATE